MTRRQDPAEVIAELRRRLTGAEREKIDLIDRAEASERLSRMLNRDIEAHRDLVTWLCSEHPVSALTVSLNVTDTRDLSRVALLTGIVSPTIGQTPEVYIEPYQAEAL